MGTGSTSLNQKKGKSFFKAKREKAKQAKKRAGAAEKHKVAVKLASGARTKKHQRKVDRRQRLASKEKDALESMMEVEQGGTAAAASNKKAKKKAAKKARAAVLAAKGAKQQPAAAVEAAATAGPEAMQD